MTELRSSGLTLQSCITRTERLLPADSLGKKLNFRERDLSVGRRVLGIRYPLASGQLCRKWDVKRPLIAGGRRGNIQWLA